MKKAAGPNIKTFNKWSVFSHMGVAQSALVLFQWLGWIGILVVLACEFMNGSTSQSKSLVKLEYFYSNDLKLMLGGD